MSPSLRPAYATRRLARCTAAACLALTLGMAHAASGPMDFLFTTGRAPVSETEGEHPRTQKFGEFSAVKLAPREAGSNANQHPVQLNPDVLRAVLSKVELLPKGAKPESLFSESELAGMVPALVSVMASATPTDDALLVSTARRRNGGVDLPITLTARLFVQNDALQLIVQDARADAYTQFRMSKVIPTLAFGSRLAGSDTVLRSALATSKRGNWLEVSFQAPPPPVAVRPTGLLNAAPGQPAVRAPSASFEETEQRLKNLKRLHEQGLLKDAEYEQKRSEVIKDL